LWVVPQVPLWSRISNKGNVKDHFTAEVMFTTHTK
jgi:hypothetical protein